MDTYTPDRTVTSLHGADLLSVHEAIFNSISDAVVFTDTLRRIVHINNAAIGMFGYATHELRGKSAELLYLSSSDYAEQGEKRFTPGKAVKPQPYEMRYRRKDGSTFIGETLGNHVNDRHGNLLGFIAVVRDITDRKRADEHATKLGRIVEDSLNEVYLFDEHDLRFTEVNRGARENLGYTLAEICKLTPVDIKPKYTREQFLSLLKPLRSGARERIRFESFHQRKDGSTYPVEVHLQLVRFGDSRTFLAIILDITERRQAEEELKLHREHLEELVAQRTKVLKEQARIIDQIHDSVVTTDLKGIVTSWNKGAERMFGYTTKEILGRHISTVYPEEDRELLQNNVIEPLQEHDEHAIDVRVLKKNGKAFYVNLSLSMLYDERGNPRGMVGYSQDITARKKAELLAQRRTEELAAANEELEGFSYSVSHDLRSPLRAIDGFSLSLAEDYYDVLDDSGKDYINRIRNGAQRMGQLIDDLLQLAKVNRSRIKRESVNLSAMAHSVINILKERNPERNVQLKINPNMSVNADPGLLRILVDNLLDNAWKYSSQEPEAVIEFGVKQDNGHDIFYVRDNGIGFDTQYADRLFKPFQRLHGANEFSGTGIGLATVLRIIQRHGGRIWAESKIHQGAAFYFTLSSESRY